MDVFLSYASEQRPLAERVCRVLEAEGHDVFFDREDLGGGDAFGQRIRSAVARADVLVYLISRSSVAPKSYALTELSIATGLPKRNRPAVLPVLTDDTPIDAVPAALRAYTILEPQGDSPAEIAVAVDRLGRQSRQRHLIVGASAGIAVALAAGVYAGVRWFTSSSTPDATTTLKATDPVPSGGPSATEAETRDPVDAFNEAVLKRTPADKLVTLTAMPGNSGWTAVLTLADLAATQVSYRLDGEREFTNTGSTGIINTMTGQPRPNTTIRIPGEFWRSRVLEVKYTDGKAVEHGPYRLNFDPRAEFLRFTKQVLATIDWVTFSELGPDQPIVHFGTLVSYKGAFKEVRYSLDNATLDKKWPLKVDPSEGWPPKYDDEQLYVAVPPATTFITVRVVYTDGSMDTRRVDAPR